MKKTNNRTSAMHKTLRGTRRRRNILEPCLPIYGQVGAQAGVRSS